MKLRFDRGAIMAPSGRWMELGTTACVFPSETRSGAPREAHTATKECTHHPGTGRSLCVVDCTPDLRMDRRLCLVTALRRYVVVSFGVWSNHLVPRVVML